MHRFIDGEDRMQQTLLPHCLEDYVGEENPVRVIEVFIDELDLAALGFSGMTPAATGRPAYHPSTLLKIYRLHALLVAANAAVGGYYNRTLRICQEQNGNFKLVSRIAGRDRRGLCPVLPPLRPFAGRRQNR